MDKSLFLSSLAAADPIMRQVELSQLANETPCTQWNLHELLNHMVNELAWVSPLLAGKTIAEVGDSLDGDLVDKHPHEAWDRYRHEAEAAAQGVLQDLTVHLSYADVTAKYYLDEMATDIYIHTWDVAKAIGAEFHIPPKIARELYRISRPKIQAMQTAGMVAKPKVATINRSAQDKLLAIYGRQS
jgi:uncharacterized protein (TIGR03086 family)